MDANTTVVRAGPWNVRVRLQIQSRVRSLALFDLGIDSKLRGCDLVKLRVRDVSHGDRNAAVRRLATTCEAHAARHSMTLTVEVVGTT